MKRISNREVLVLVQTFLSTSEDDNTRRLIRRLRPARTRGYLTRSEFEAVCVWKSPRAIHHIKANSPSQVRTATRRALATRDEGRRLSELMALRGVAVPMASSILMFVDPARYGVIDIRVWQLLYAIGTVAKKPRGVGFTVNDWCAFLATLRSMATRFHASARDVERALFRVHQEHQLGRLYGGRTARVT